MYAVLFEASTHAGQADAYFQRASDLRPRVERIDGFLSIGALRVVDDRRTYTFAVDVAR